MNPTKYHREKSKINSSKRLSEKQKETRKFNLWVEMIFNNVSEENKKQLANYIN